ncbi:MAG: hypothetical protein ABSE41_03295 [Bacteroidota bacterium]|jgi:hypothetical protein
MVALKIRGHKKPPRSLYRGYQEYSTLTAALLLHPVHLSVGDFALMCHPIIHQQENNGFFKASLCDSSIMFKPTAGCFEDRVLRVVIIQLVVHYPKGKWV